MKKTLIIFFSLFCAFSVSAQTVNLNSNVPFDAKVRTGKLPNGLTYFVRKNVKPEHRAEMRLVINAGAVLENDSQQGLAHLLEHMCFNGTKNFEKSAIVDFLESAGMTFGADLNAYTAFDETVYMLQIPTDTPAIFKKGMQILNEWAHNVTLDPKEIDKERGVVVEEWRLGQGAEERMLRKFYPIMFYNSQYANRLPIGKKEIIEGAPYDTIKQFYKDWYRPNLMAVVVVGDVDVDAVEKMIKEEFGGLTNPQNERARKSFPVPDTKDIMVSVCTDKEASYTSMQIMYKQPTLPSKTVNDYRQTLVNALFTGMLDDRFAELRQQTDAPFAYAGAGYGNIARTKAAYYNYAVVTDGGIERGLKSVLAENKRIKQFGFTASELERQKKQMIRRVEKTYNENDKTESRNYTREYVSYFLNDEPSPGIAWEYEMYQKLLPTVSLDEVNKLATQWITDGSNCFVVITAPDKAGVTVPTEDQVKQIIKDAQQATVTAYDDKVIDKPLMATKPTAGKVVKENTIAQYGITEWTLSNGAKVLLKPTDFKNDEILFSAYSYGGSSLYPDKDDMSASYAAAIVDNSGIGDFDATQLSKYLSDKVLSISPSIGETMESFSGQTSPKDIETFMQLLHMYFTSPRKDSVGYKSLMTQMTSSIQNRQNDPGSALEDSVDLVMHQYNVRYTPISLERLNQVDLNRAYDIYKDRFSNGGEFTYVFVGSFKPEEIKPLVEMYIGGLPSKARTETYKDLGIQTPKGNIHKVIARGTEPKSTVEILYSGPFTYTRHNRIETYALIKLANIKLRETLREDMSGVYGVSAWPQLTHFPKQTYQMGIYFSCAPENVDKLVAATVAVIDSIKQYGCSEKDLLKVKELSLKERETGLKENRFWLSTIVSNYQNNENILEMADFEKQINAITSDDFKRLAKQYYNPANYAKFVLNPQPE